MVKCKHRLIILRNTRKFFYQILNKEKRGFVTSVQSTFSGLGLLQGMLVAGKWRSQEYQCLIEDNACKRLNMFWLCYLKACESQRNSECSKGWEQSQFLTFSTQIKLLFLGRLCKTILYHSNGQKLKQAQMLTALKSRDGSRQHGRGAEGGLTDNHDECLWLFFHTYKCNKHQTKHSQVGIWAVFI